MENKLEIAVTQEGYEALKQELDWRLGEKRNEILEKIKEAKAQGDLSENAEYSAAREAQGLNESRIAELTAYINAAKIVETSVDKDVVAFGSVVTVFNHRSNKELTYTIVGETEAKPFEGKISNNSPIAKALIGHRLGETVSAITPAGEIKLDIKAITI